MSEPPKKPEKPATPPNTFETLGNAVIWNTYGRILQTGLKLVSAVLLARYLGPTGLGIYAILVSAARLLSLPIVAGTAQLTEREVSGAFGDGRVQNARAAVRFMLGSVLVFGILGGLFLSQFLGIFGLPETGAVPLMGAALGLFVVNIATGTVRGIVRGEGQTGLAMIPFNMIALLSPLGYMLWHLGVQDLTPEVAVWIHVTAQAVILPVWAWIALRHWPRPADPAGVPNDKSVIPRRWYGETAQFMLMGASTVALSEAGILLLAYYSTPEEVSQFRVATRIYVLAVFAVGLAQSVFSPQVAKLWRSGQTEKLAQNARTLAGASLLFGLVTTLSFVLLGPFLLPFVFGPDFAGAYWPAVILCMTALIAGAAPVSGKMLKMAGFQSWVTIASLLALVAVIGLNVLLSPVFGAVGCALSLFLSTLLARMVNNWGVRRQMGFSPLADRAALQEVARRGRGLPGKLKKRLRGKSGSKGKTKGSEDKDD